MLQFIGKFIGPEEILEVKDTGVKTHRGVEILDVITRRQGTDDKTRLTTTTPKALELITSNESCDWNAPQEKKLQHVVSALMEIATDYSIQGGELQTMLAKFGLSLATQFEHAAHIKFEGNDDEFVPGGSEFYTWSLAKAESVIVNKNVVTPEETAS
jgi:hypothetical protein